MQSYEHQSTAAAISLALQISIFDASCYYYAASSLLRYTAGGYDAFVPVDLKAHAHAHTRNVAYHTRALDVQYSRNWDARPFDLNLASSLSETYAPRSKEPRSDHDIAYHDQQPASSRSQHVVQVNVVHRS